MQGLPAGVYWPAERLIQKGITTLQEIETHYSINDLFNRIESLESVERAEAVLRARKPGKVEQ